MNETGALPLFIVSKDLYEIFCDQLARVHLQLYDMEALGKATDDGVNVMLAYGAAFDHGETASFSYIEIKNRAPVVARFFQEAAEKCKETLIRDYYKMIKL